ncbi:O-antigen ligase family protein [Microlunatus parietis]|uniref:O-antigen ligase-related domain-containing protein n=1 Tax=Microlunatus parietis TaxID=682979 RepID=A0A7Y9LDP5_9ACTN|nr:O-antigen ligase family protein [Microlunatus parietis]NYE73020.1 hypothetical protein [Microlunatus parietis]
MIMIARAFDRIRTWLVQIRTPGHSLPAVIFVIGYAALLLCIPAQLVIRPLGAVGAPASLWGLGALLWWILITLRGHNPVRGLTGLRLGFGLLTLAVLAGYAAGHLTGWYAPPSIRQSTDEFWTLLPSTVAEVTATMMSAADRGLLAFAGWLGILLITAEGLRSRDDLDLVIRWLVRFGAVIAVLGIIQYFTGFNIAGLFQLPGLSANSEFGAVDSRSVLNRVVGTATHPIEFGVVMAGLLPLAVHQSLFPRKTSRRRILPWLPTILIGTAMPMSVSRSAILAAAVAGLVLLIGWPWRWRIRALLILPFVVVGMRLLAPGLVGTIRSLFANLQNDPSVSGRTDDYAVVLALYAENPWFGRGLFTFVPRYYRILDNQLLMILIELGLFGLLALVIAFGSAFGGALLARRRTADPALRHLALAVAGAICGVVLSYATFDAFGFPIAAGLSFLLFGLAGAAANLTRRRADPAVEPTVITTSPRGTEVGTRT